MIVVHPKFLHVHPSLERGSNVASVTSEQRLKVRQNKAPKALP